MKTYCTETEREVLAGVISHPSELTRNIKILNVDLFYVDEHRSIYEEMIRQLEQERRVSPDSMRNKFEQLGWEDRKGNKISDLIGAFCAAPPEPDEITELIIQLTDLNYSRRVEAACEKIKRHATENIGIL